MAENRPKMEDFWQKWREKGQKWWVFAKNGRKWAKNGGKKAKIFSLASLGEKFQRMGFAKFSTPEGGFWPTPPLGHPCYQA